jgi:hypothetical protein
MSIVVICPTRGRPEKARDAYDAFLNTRVLPDTKMEFVVDADDPSFGAYVKQQIPIVTYEHEGGGMGPPLNVAVKDLSPHYDITGFVGDDHRFRTPGWDEMFTECLTEHAGFVFGNDLVRDDIPTQVFVNSKIVLALGWMALPGAKHLYLDNTWLYLGSGIGRMFYMPAVIIEHMHPIAGKSAMDEGYARVNHPSMYEHDSIAFSTWVDSGQAAKDIEVIKAVL